MNDTYNKVFALFEEIQEEMMKLRANVTKLTPAELVDTGFQLRECETLLDESRKEMASRRQFIAKLICTIAAERALAGSDVINVQGELATASPDIKHNPKIPKTGSPEYLAMMAWLGIDRDKALMGVVKPHFVKLSEYLTKLAEDGENPPAFFKTFPEYSVTYRRKK